MKLHWSPRSPFVRYVMIVAHEKNLVGQIELERSVVAMTAPNASVMADNPLSKIPTLVLDNGTTLVDSRNIARYFDQIGEGAKLFPQLDDDGAEIFTREAIAIGHLDALILWRHEMARLPEVQSPELLAAFAVKHEAVLHWYERSLIEGAFDASSIATACALGYLDFRYKEMDWRSKHLELAEWYRTIADRPSFAATRPIDQ